MSEYKSPNQIRHEKAMKKMKVEDELVEQVHQELRKHEFYHSRPTIRQVLWTIQQNREVLDFLGRI